MGSLFTLFIYLFIYLSHILLLLTAYELNMYELCSWNRNLSASQILAYPDKSIYDFGVHKKQEYNKKREVSNNVRSQ